MGLAGEESQEKKVFVLCFCVWRVRHHFSEGVCTVRSSKVWVFPAGSRAESWGGRRADSSAVAGGDQPELEEMMGRDELHPNVGIPVHLLGAHPRSEWGSDVHTIPVKCQLGSLWLRCKCAGSVRFLGCYHRTNQSSY